jgi:hypothetical protein
MRTKLKLSCVLASLAAVAALGTAGTAAAGENGSTLFEAGDPMTTNVPYVAWAGEEIRLVKCVDDPEGDWDDTDAEWNIVDSSVRQRSGDLRDPVFFDDVDRRTGAFDGGGEQSGRTCWAIDVDSVNPGMTRIKMAVDDGNQPGSPALKHDFLVIWLNMGNPVLTELGESTFPGIPLGDQDGGNPASYTPRDIDGDGDLEYGPGLIRVTVAGSFTDLHGNARSLPADWASLAGVYAFDTSGYNPMAWDIHDDQSLESIHSAASFCAPPKAGAIDGVDNCLGGGLGEIGRFSRTIGGTGHYAGETIGPFDPARPDTSYLPNGRLDAGDAPMPAARIDLSLTGGVGALASAEKNIIYSRNRTGATTAHNLYAPFYMALIPADFSQIRPSYTSSGVTGPIPNNFPDFQTEGIFGFGVRGYDYWDFLNEHRRGGYNECYDVGGDGQFGDGDGQIGRPSGVDEATVYTDEHGEALAWFLPDVGAVLDPDDQGLCDLGDSPDPELLGTATIAAEALDPFQLTFNAPRLATPLVKDVNELAYKALDCFPKNNIEAVCIETIVDIWGNPVEGAPVLFSAESEGTPAVIGLGEWNTFAGNECEAVEREDYDVDGQLCWTNEDGQAGVIVRTTLDTLVDVISENYATRNVGFGVMRDRCIDFNASDGPLPTDGPSCSTPNAPGPVTPPDPPGGGGGGGGGGTSSGGSVVAQSPPVATIVSLAGNPAPAKAAPAAKAPKAKAKAKKATKLVSARLVVVKGKRYLVVRANGSAKTAKIRITLVKRTGQADKPVVRTIRTNKAVRVANLRVDRHVRTVRVALAR